MHRIFDSSSGSFGFIFNMLFTSHTDSKPAEEASKLAVDQEDDDDLDLDLDGVNIDENIDTSDINFDDDLLSD
ncbi:unnamed protein product [Callosobruchus maculatus]|uniref:Uncharacterized protein n=1 Tax=Callosobruchus maculatus TaxID=64391 RepID=A0A653BGZ1_CALMS|nr:unnamed protein product [Callosobruchus maculatus]